MSQSENVREVRFVSIPEGLHQERVDAALSRLLGLSRSVVVTLIESDEVKRGGKALSKSDRVNTDDYLEITMPPLPTEAVITPTPIDNLKVVYDDSDVIVIDGEVFGVKTVSQLEILNISPFIWHKQSLNSR